MAGKGGSGHLLNAFDQGAEAGFLGAPLQAPEPDTAQILDPFEIADRYAAGIGVEIRDDDRAARVQDFVRLGRDRAICRLDDEGGLDTRRIDLGDDKLHRCRDQNIGLGFEMLHPAVDIAGISPDASGFGDMRAQRRDVDPGLVDDRAVAFKDMGDERPVHRRQEQRRMVADIAKSLDNDTLAGQPRRKAGLGDITRVIEKGPQRVLHAATGGFGPAGNAALMHRLSGDAGPGIQFRRMQALIFIGHPGHLAFAGADIGRRHILRGVDEIALRQFLCETAGDAFKLAFGPVTRIDDQPALRAAEGHLDKGTFVAHQRGKRLNLVLIDVGGEADAALDRFEMLGMNRPVAGECMELSAKPDPEPHDISGVGNHDLGRKVIANAVIAVRCIQACHGVAEIGLD